MKLQQDGWGDKNLHQFSWSPVGSYKMAALFLNELVIIQLFNSSTILHKTIWGKIEQRLYMKLK